MSNNLLVLGEPQPKQAEFLRDRHFHSCMGGARGGGKSWTLRFEAKLLCLDFPGIKVGIVRTTYPELQKNHIEPLRSELCPCGVATYNDSRKEMRFKNKSLIYFFYCDSDRAAERFSGLEVDVLMIDEATHFKKEHLDKMRACVRGANNFRKQIRYTCNPDGQSLSYVRRIFIDRQYEEGENPDDYHFVQSLLYDNEYLMRDDQYKNYLESLPDSLRRAWLEGDWNVFEGIYFDEFRDKPDVQKCIEAGITTEEALAEHRWTHVIEPFEPPVNWNIYRSYDFGYGRPFSVGYWAVSPDDTAYHGAAYRILEVYGCTKNPNEGVRWTAKQQFDYLRELEDTHPWLKGKRIQGVADPAIWEGSHGISIAEEADKHGIWFEKGINDRIAGWMQCRERLKFDANGYAMVYFFNTCKGIIRTLPTLVHDEHRVEDLDSSGEDHCADEFRYFAMSRPITPRDIKTEYKPLLDPLDQFKNKRGTWTAYNNITRR